MFLYFLFFLFFVVIFSLAMYILTKEDDNTVYDDSTGGPGSDASGNSLVTSDQSTQSSGTKKALLIGINYRNTNSELNGCVNDALSVKALLVQKWGFKDDHIVLLTDDTHIQPTRDNIITSVKSLVESAEEGDVLFVHYSGHGSYVLDKNGDEDDNFDECLVPLDFQQQTSGLITDDELYQTLVKPISDKSLKLFMLCDSCHSGTALDLHYIFRPNGDNTRMVKTNSKWGQRQTTKAKVVFVSGCLDPEYSNDITTNSGAFGAMTRSFIETVTSDTSTLTFENLLLGMNNIIRNDLSILTQNPQISTSYPIESKETLDLTIAR